MTENPTAAFKGVIQNYYQPSRIVKPCVAISPPVSLTHHGRTNLIHAAIVPPDLISKFQEVGMGVEGELTAIETSPGNYMNMVVTMQPATPG